jgi:hypothetical protein
LRKQCGSSSNKDNSGKPCIGGTMEMGRKENLLHYLRFGKTSGIPCVDIAIVLRVTINRIATTKKSDEINPKEYSISLFLKIFFLGSTPLLLNKVCSVFD